MYTLTSFYPLYQRGTVAQLVRVLAYGVERVPGSKSAQSQKISCYY